MHIVRLGLTVVVALMLLATGLGALTGNERTLQNIDAVNFPRGRAWLLGLLEILGAVGLVVGFFFSLPLFYAAAVGVILYFIGALVFHARAQNRAIMPALVLLVATCVLLAITVAA